MNKNESKINEDIVKHVAELSRLSLGEDDVRKYQQQLSRIIQYIEQLNEVDTKGVSPTTHVLPSMKNVFRDDIPEVSLPQEEALRNAPSRAGNFFKVPRIIKDA